MISAMSILVSLVISAGPSEAADGAWRKQIAELETRLFEPILAVDEVERLLEQLNPPETRAKAARKLAEQGQGHVERVVAFARDCPDLEARQACVDIVEALDAAYRTSAMGQQLGAIYRAHTEALLPIAAPWWAGPYVPPAYRQQIGFAAQSAGAAAPDLVREERLAGVLSPKLGLAPAKIDPSAPSIVLLPPRFGVQPSPPVQSAAELACDRLAEEIAAAGLARVVDRTQLDRLLQERELATSPSGPMSSYDAMLRMEVDDMRLPPETRLSAIDLSTGNVLGQRVLGWPLVEADVAAMLALCRDALQHVSKPPAGKLRVRTLWSTEDVDNERIRPLARRLGGLFDESLRRSDGVLLVNHLEAATSKEESLLLLMGLSRLPGGRQFTPQADATIELALREGDGRGKTFQETPVEIRVRITRGGPDRDQSLTTVGTVARFDRAAAEAWEKLAGVLREARPGAAAGCLDEMAVRRRQAEAELCIGRTLRGDRMEDYAKLLARVAHTEAAMKIDPTCEEAAVEHLTSLYRLNIRWPEIVPGQVPCGKTDPDSSPAVPGASPGRVAESPTAATTGPLRTAPAPVSAPAVPSLVLRQAGAPGGVGRAGRPLAAADGLLYVLLDPLQPWEYSPKSPPGDSGSPLVASLPLDKTGRPVGKIREVAEPKPDKFWDTLTPLPQPRPGGPPEILAAICLGKKLVLGTQDGLLIFDPQAGKWSSFGTAQGLPEKAVVSLYRLDERTLVCAGKKNVYDRGGACYSLALPEGKVTLLHRMSDPWFDPVPALYWQSGGKLFAWSRNGFCGDLLSSKLTCTSRMPTPYGWSPHQESYVSMRLGYLGLGVISMAEAGGRRFITDAGLHEFDSKGKVLRSWWVACNLQAWCGGPPYTVSVPQDCPIQSMDMVAMGDLLAFVHLESIMAWDPRSDTWYGPLPPSGTYALGWPAGFPPAGGPRPPGAYPLGVPAGVWISGLRFIAAEDVLAAARRAGRVMTTAEYRKRQEEIVAAMPPLDRAKAEFTMHRFDAAKALLDEILKNDPASPEALLLMGWLHDIWCANEPETALRYYRRLADVTSNPRASVEGWYQQMCLLGKLQRWPETLAAAEHIKSRFPQFNEYDRSNVDWWRDEAKKHVSPAENRKAVK